MRSNASLVWVGSSFAIEDADDYVEQILADEPEAYYRLSSSTNINDSVGSRDGTFVSPPVDLASGPLTEDEPEDNYAISFPPTYGSGVPIGTLPNDLDVSLATYGGSYEAGFTYHAGDIASSAGSFWVATATTTGNAPSLSSPYWNKFAPSSKTYPLSLASFNPWTIEFWYRSSADIGWDDWPLLRGTTNFPRFNTAWGFMVSRQPDSFFVRKFIFSTNGMLDGPTLYLTCDLPEDHLTTWHHYAVTNSISGRTTLYIDGLPVANGAATLNPGSLGPIELRFGWSPWFPWSPPTAEFAHLAFYSRELCEERIAAHFNAAP